MTFPVVASVTATAFGTAATAHNVNMPATVNAGDLLLIHFGTGSGFTGPGTDPSGWTKQYNNGAAATLVEGFIKLADGTEGGTTVNVATTGSCKAAALVYRITGWFGNISTGLDASGSASGTSTQPDSPSLDPFPWAAEDTLWLTVASLNADTTVGTAPTNYGDVQSQSSAGSGGAATKCVVGGADRNLNATSDDPGAWGAWGTSAAWWAFTFAVRPVAAVSSQPIDVMSLGQMPAILAQ